METSSLPFCLQRGLFIATGGIFFASGNRARQNKPQPGGAAHRPARGISFLPVPALPVDRLRRADHHLSILRHRIRQECVAAHHGMIPDGGLTAQNGGPGVDGHVAAHGGMPLPRQTGVALPRGQRSQRHALIQLHISPR